MSRRTDAMCPRDCPRRSAIPNCHNTETCEIWAAYVQRQELLKEARRKSKAAEKDAVGVAVACSRRLAKEARRKRCRN